jgi:hypothetical protein
MVRVEVLVLSQPPWRFIFTKSTILDSHDGGGFGFEYKKEFSRNATSNVRTTYKVPPWPQPFPTRRRAMRARLSLIA